MLDWGTFNDKKAAMVLLRVSYEDGEPDSYLLPLTMAFGASAAEMQERSVGAILAPVYSPQGMGVVHDALHSDEVLSALLALIADGGTIEMGLGAMEQGEARGAPSSMLGSLRDEATDLRPLRSSAEQSNSSIFFGDKLIMKLFRRQQPGVNPDTEIGRYLTEETNFRNTAPFGGAIEYHAGADTYTFAMLQGLVANEGDGWQWTLEELDRYFESSFGDVFPAAEAAQLPADLVALSEAELPDKVRDSVGIYLDAAAKLGQRTGELHLALGQDTTDLTFAPQAFTVQDAEALRAEFAANATRAFDALENNLASLPDETVEAGGLVLSRRTALSERLRQLAGTAIGGMQTRVHGDYHLGQILRTRSDFVILDFEGEPARSLEERRAKQSPLKDVAGMLRSFSYAAFASLSRYTTRRPQDTEMLEPWARLWEQAVSGQFLRSYREAVGSSSIVPTGPAAFRSLLEAFILDKAFYELVYELNNRPAWVRIPLHGILSLTL